MDMSRILPGIWYSAPFWPGRKLINDGNVGNLGIFFRFFLFPLFDFGLILKIANSEKENSDNKFRRFQRFRRFRVLLFFRFLFLFFVILGYWTVIIQHANKSMFKSMYYICSKLKKLTKLISVTGRLCLI